MIIRYDWHRAIWIAESTYEEKDELKGAGFRWDRDRRRWFTKDPDIAAELIEHCDDVARAAIEAVRAEKARALEASRATDSDIEIPAPEGLEYLPFQRAGIAYALSRDTALIADEMGLGKTVQALGIVNADESIRKALIVCPAYLKLNWAREARRWLARDMKVEIATSKGFSSDADVVIVNYDVLGKLKERLHHRTWDLIAFDEAHYLKNPKAARTKAALGDGKKVWPLPARKRVFLTGTPILNRPIELWPLVQAANLGISWYEYATKFCAGKRTRWGWDVSGASNLDQLQELLRSNFMVRRLKTDVLRELPAKRHQVIELEAQSREAKAAMKAEREAYAKVRGEVERLEKAAKAAKASGDADAYKAAVKALARGRMAAFTEISKMRHEVALAKAPQVIEAAAEVIENGEAVIVFSHHRDVAEAIAEGLKSKEIGTVAVHGGMSPEDRQAAADAFQAGKAKAFVGTIGAAGTGLTLTAASTVIFAELDWTPGAMAQAEDRAHRIGQENSVLVQHLVLEGSIDAEMAHRLVDKSDVIAASLDAAEAAESGSEGGADAGVPASAPAPVAARARTAIIIPFPATSPRPRFFQEEGSDRVEILHDRAWIMRRAWEIARTYAAGGVAGAAAHLSEALRQSWREYREEIGLRRAA
jgi:SWI/SNF-related matrix-associated actin-dependent regulator 1 of chromatin subfamily A